MGEMGLRTIHQGPGDTTSAVRRTDVVRLVDFVHRPASILPKVTEMHLRINKRLLSAEKKISSLDFGMKRLEDAIKGSKGSREPQKAFGT